jgi:putative ABC transport system substrate-binding protein
MRRREFITLIGGAVTWSITARAKQPQRMRRIGGLTVYAETDREAQARFAAFQLRLQQLGWTIGQNMQIDYRWSHGEADQARALAKQLVEMQPDVILGEATAAVRALQQATDKIPIVFTNVSNPIGSGFVKSMSRPGGNITGFSNFESSMGGKWLEVLKEIAPDVLRVAVMFNPKASTHIAAGYYMQSLQEAAQKLAVEQTPAPVQNPDDIERAIELLAQKPGGGLIVLPDTFTVVHLDQITSLAAQYRLPAIYSFNSFTSGGGLVCYGINSLDQFPRAASYIDRILRGERPGDLPVQTPTKFELVINLKAAKAIGLEVPSTLLNRADLVIE